MNRSLRGAIAALLLVVPAAVSAAADITMHRDPGCGCCEKWATQVRHQFGRNVRIIDDANRATLQRQVGVPSSLGSCHTAIINGLAFEGHVPIADMKRVLTQRPSGVRGLAVAGMPMGSPGMEVAGMKAQPYDVIAFGVGGSRRYAHHS